MDSQPDYFANLRNKALLFRVLAHLTIAAIAVSVPSVGPNRFFLAGFLLFIGTPTAIYVNRRIQSIERNWAEALVDLVMVVTLIHLTPHLWMVGMALGLMVALAPSISLHPRSHWIYMGFGAVLLSGMTLTAVVHDVENWILVTVAVAITYPALLFYTYSQMQSANELRKRAEMVQGMTQLAGSMAHDFNNMLMGISGHTEVAMLSLPEDHAARVNLQKVLEGTKRASLLTNRLLSFAGRDLGKKEIINVVQEFRMIAELLQPVLPSGIDVKVTASDNALFVESNVSDLHQVWMNVLINAGESMLGKQETIEVHFSRETNTQQAANKVNLSIADRGDGISEELIDQVFDPFFTTKAKGHGLGLAVSKRIMQQLGGDIRIKRRTGGGTEVLISCLEAPAPDLVENPQSDTSIRSDSEATPTVVLIVDDEAEIRSTAAELLTSLGHESLLASNADEAISVFESQHERIGVVLLDLKMPGRDGWSCLQDLRGVAATKPVIICSGFNPADESPTFAKEDPNLQFLSKPFQKDSLLETMAKFA